MTSSISSGIIKIFNQNRRRQQSMQGKDPKALAKKSKSFRLETNEPLTYNDLIEYIVDVDYVIRFERKNDFDTVSNKTLDFSKTTIGRLIDDGYNECKEQMANASRKVK